MWVARLLAANSEEGTCVCNVSDGNTEIVNGSLRTLFPCSVGQGYGNREWVEYCMSISAVENLAGNTDKQVTFAGLNVRWTCISRDKTLTQSRHSTNHSVDVAFLVPQKKPRST